MEKFLESVPQLVEAYRAAKYSWLALTEDERKANASQSFLRLFSERDLEI